MHHHNKWSGLVIAVIGMGLFSAGTAQAESEPTIIKITPDAKLVKNVKLTKHEMGLQLLSSGPKGGTVLTKLDEPITSGKVTFSLSYKATRKDNGPRNGFLLLGASEGLGNIISVGTLIGGQAHYIDVRSKHNKMLKDATIKNQKIDTVVTVDLDAKTITMKIGEKNLETVLPENFKAIRTVGYKAINTQTVFSPITITR
ncbi:hypothetical protein JYU15_02460 [bacterium AH-315-I18]|nr:hypothetical protein [bacterium AH-315-I18]